MRKVKKIVVHVSASPDTMDIGAAEIRQWHMADNGWSDIGYHAVVRRDGTIEVGRPESQTGAHVKGHNAGSLGVCWVGRDTPEPAQYQGIINQVADWCVQYELTEKDVLGHRELAPLNGKTCPNLDMPLLRQKVASRIRQLKNN